MNVVWHNGVAWGSAHTARRWDMYIDPGPDVNFANTPHMASLVYTGDYYIVSEGNKWLYWYENDQGLDEWREVTFDPMPSLEELQAWLFTQWRMR